MDVCQLQSVQYLWKTNGILLDENTIDFTFTMIKIISYNNNITD